MESVRFLNLLGVALLVLALSIGCETASPGEMDGDDTADDDDSAGDVHSPGDDDDSAVVGPLEPLFTFVVFADPHLSGSPDHAARLQAAIDWVHAERKTRGIELVVVLGDIGWHEGLQQAFDMLSTLTVPWVPIIGDNVLQTSGDGAFWTTFGPQLDVLAIQLSEWAQAPSPVYDERLDADAWLQNLRFEHQGVLFVSQDWNIRHETGLLAEFGDFNDVPGGSWDWLTQSLEDAAQRPDESVCILSHVPMAPISFDLEERTRFAELVAPISDKVFANFAGHLHADYEEEFSQKGFATYVTDALWDDENTLRAVQVFGNAQERAYDQELVILD